MLRTSVLTKASRGSHLLVRASSHAARHSGITVVVKGDPQRNELGDCPFCHRVLLTLAQKAGAGTQSWLPFGRAWGNTLPQLAEP
jgi:hypothetical protein